MNRTEKCFICGRSTENGLDVCPDCFSRLPDCCKEKYTKLLSSSPFPLNLTALADENQCQ